MKLPTFPLFSLFPDLTDLEPVDYRHVYYHGPALPKTPEATWNYTIRKPTQNYTAKQTKNKLHLEIELPGVKNKNITVTKVKNKLHITAVQTTGREKLITLDFNLGDKTYKKTYDKKLKNGILHLTFTEKQTNKS